MTMRVGRLAIALVATTMGFAGLARADAQTSTAAVTVTPAVASIGQTISVEATGFPVDHAVVVTLCGNQARRGSVDCDLSGSVAFPISKYDAHHLVPFVVGRPPVPCPCVIEVTNVPLADVAYAPITIKGFPTAPVVGDDFFQPLELQVRVHRAAQNPFAWLRSFVGGPTPYDVDVAIHNRAGDAVNAVKVVARAGRSASDQSRQVALPVPPSLNAGQTWQHRERVTLSAPVIGRFVWTVTATGDAALSRSIVHTRLQPYGLYLMLLALVGDIGWLAARRLRKRTGGLPKRSGLRRFRSR